jgi:peptidoglycan hydrolase-like protein with peptidoglycan-binding domain
MDMLSLIPYIALGVKYGSSIIALVQSATSNTDLATKIETLPAEVLKVANAIGAEMFPAVKPELQAAAGAVAGFNHAFTIWCQEACNMLLPDTPKLTVDGIYGPMTTARVKKLQQSLNISTIDGWVGKLTRAAIDSAIAKITGAVAANQPMVTPAAAIASVAASMKK